MKGRGNQIQTKFLLSTLTLALPHRKGEEIIEKFKISLDRIYVLSPLLPAYRQAGPPASLWLSHPSAIEKTGRRQGQKLIHNLSWPVFGKMIRWVTKIIFIVGGLNILWCFSKSAQKKRPTPWTARMGLFSIIFFGGKIYAAASPAVSPSPPVGTSSSVYPSTQSSNGLYLERPVPAGIRRPMMTFSFNPFK